jgi:aarF domain-containing kinase
MGTILDTLMAARRVGQTVMVLGTTAAKWAMGDRPPTPRLLRQTFEELGATYIKLGQFIASSPTFFPKEYIEEFQLCLDKTRAIPFNVIERILREELGEDYLSVYFSSIDEKPLASASIAQVHAARLLTGEDVVIKVQKPGVRNTLLTDLNFLYVAAKVMETLAPKLSWTSLSGIIEEIQRTMVEECDFYKEADNLREFQKFLNETENDQVVVPKVYGHASSLRVLTMERFYGVPLTDLETIRKYCSDPESTLVTAMNTWFASLTQCNFFHADVHAGNLMVLKDGKVGFIDFGIVGRIGPGTWAGVSDFITAIMMGNFHGMADALSRIGITKTEVNIDVFAEDIKNLYSRMDIMEPDSAVVYNMKSNDEDINSILMEIVRIGEQHGLHFPREFALLLKQFLYFDRYVHILAPELDMFMDERLSMLQ